MILIARKPVLFHNMKHDISLLQDPFAWIHWHPKRQITALKRKSRNGWSSPQSVMVVRSCVTWRNEGHGNDRHLDFSAPSRYRNFALVTAILNNFNSVTYLFSIIVTSVCIYKHNLSSNDEDLKKKNCIKNFVCMLELLSFLVCFVVIVEQQCEAMLHRAPIGD